MQVIRRDPSKGYLDCLFWLPKAFCNVNGVKSALTFQVADKDDVLTLWRETAHHILVPREFWDLSSPDFTFPIVDCRPTAYPKVVIRSKIHLDHRRDNGKLIPTGEVVQQASLDAMLASRGGILQLACGKGKTVVFLELSARLCVPTLIVVDTTQLIVQWREAINDFLDVPGGIGMIGDGEFDWKKSVVLATYHTLAARAATFPEEARRWFGLIGWDEAHHVAAPTFARSADLFFGQRYGLTATPIRADGMHVVYNFHVGKVLYKNLQQDLKPQIFFKWTGLQLDPQDPKVVQATRDKNGELHLGKVAGYFGAWPTRLKIIVDEVVLAAAQGRKIIVLSKSVDETVNLLAMWNGRTDLYTDIPYPTSMEVGEKIQPIEMTPKEYKKIQQQVAIIWQQLQDKTLNIVKAQNLTQKRDYLKTRLAQCDVWRKTEALYHKRQREYLKALLAQKSTGGLMIYKVDPDVRTKLLRSKQVTFAISKYGREGLDEKSLDTIVVCEPLSDQGALQQLMGRIQRKKDGKQSPVVVFLEDDVGLLIGMCRKLRQHLREWPVEEGGPYDYELLGHPVKENRRTPWTSRSLRM